MQCLKNKTGIMENIIDKYKIDILCVSEHWIVSDEVSFYSKLGNLKLVSSYCRSSKSHGGVAIFAKSEFQLVETKLALDINMLSVELDCELCCIEIKDENLVLVTVYRSPVGNLDNFFTIIEKSMCLISRSNKQSIFCGDFNLHFGTNNNDTQNFVNLSLMYGLRMTITEPTRQNHCLDNIFTSLDTNLEAEVRNFHVSDHLGLFFNLPSSKPVHLVSNSLKTNRPTEYRSTKTQIKINTNSIQIFKYHLRKESWKEVFNSFDVNENFEVFISILQFYFNISFTKQVPCTSQNKKTCKPLSSWYTNELMKLKQRLDVLYCLAKSEPNNVSSLKDQYRVLKLFYRHKIREAKKLANSKQIKESGNPTKALWKIINNVKSSGKKNTSSNVFSPGQYNKFFINVAKEAKQNLVSNNERSGITSSMYVQTFLDNKNDLQNWPLMNFRPVTESCVIDVVKHLSPKTSKDHYGFSNRLIKDTILCYVTPLTALINLCLNQGKFPNVLKITKVYPVHKKSKKDDLNNYRPIALVPILSKVLELLIGKQLMYYFESNKFLTSAQFGFRKGLSTIHAVIRLTEEILDCYEKKDFAAVTFCDLSKAFDCVSHNLLLEKLEHYKVQGFALSVLKTYLQNRFQYVSCNNTKSSCLEVSCGVPQGSVLGPLLFLIMANDVGTSVSTEVVLYADDTTIINRHANRSQALEVAKLNQNSIQNWMTANELVLNENKTSTVLFGLKDKAALTLEFPKFLGLTLDPTLCWSQHIIGVKKKLSQSIYALKRLCGELDQDGLRQAYFGMFQAHLSYGILAWGSASQAVDVFVLQKKALRVIAGVGKYEHCSNIFKKFNILTFYSLYIFNCLLYVKLNPDLFTTRKEVHSHNTRYNNLIDVPQHRLCKSDKSPKIMSFKLYNKLPSEIRQLNFTNYKRKINKFLLNRPFYSVHDFTSRQWNVIDFS